MTIFPDHGSPAGTPPNYVPEGWAVRYVRDGGEKWKKYPRFAAARAGINGMREMGTSDWTTGPWTAEIWQWVGTGWYLYNTEVHRKVSNGKALGTKWEVFSA